MSGVDWVHVKVRHRVVWCKRSKRCVGGMEHYEMAPGQAGRQAAVRGRPTATRSGQRQTKINLSCLLTLCRDTCAKVVRGVQQGTPRCSAPSTGASPVAVLLP